MEDIDYGALFGINAEGEEVTEPADPSADTTAQGENEQEPAEPAAVEEQEETTGEAEGGGQSTGEDSPEGQAAQPKQNPQGVRPAAQQTPEQNAQFAAARRKAEAERDAAIAKARQEAQAEAQRTIDEAFRNSGLTNPYTKKPIRTKAGYDEYRARFEAEKAASGYSNAPIMAMLATISCYNKGSDWVKELVEYITGNRDYFRQFVQENFPKARFVEPEGTYLIWVDFSGYGFSDEELEHLMLEEAHLWLDSGKIFGPATAQFERFNIACPRSTVEQCLRQLKQAMDQHQKW